MRISLAALWLMVIGLGLIFLGVPPGGEEIVRSLVFLLIAIFYAGVWLSLAMLLSIVFRSAGDRRAGRARRLAVLTVLWPMLAPALAQVISPPDALCRARAGDAGHVDMAQTLARLSPNHLFGEAMLAVLSPTTRRSARCFSNNCAAP